MAQWPQGSSLYPCNHNHRHLITTKWEKSPIAQATRGDSLETKINILRDKMKNSNKHLLDKTKSPLRLKLDGHKLWLSSQGRVIKCKFNRLTKSKYMLNLMEELDRSKRCSRYKSMQLKLKIKTKIFWSSNWWNRTGTSTPSLYRKNCIGKNNNLTDSFRNSMEIRTRPQGRKVK